MTAPFKQGSLIVSGTYSEPVFRLSQSSHSMQQALFRSLQPYDLTVDNMQEAGAYSGPLTWSLALRFLGFLAQLVITVQRYELTVTVPTLAQVGEFSEMLDIIEQTIRQQVEPAELGTREMLFIMHFENPKLDVQERFGIKAPESLGTLSGTGVNLRLTDPLFEGEVHVGFDKSAAHEGAVFASIRCTLDAAHFDVQKSSENFKVYVDRVVAFLEQGE